MSSGPCAQWLDDDGVLIIVYVSTNLVSDILQQYIGRHIIELKRDSSIIESAIRIFDDEVGGCFLVRYLADLHNQSFKCFTKCNMFELYRWDNNFISCD